MTYDYCYHIILNSETKIYRLQTPTSPFFRPLHYDKIQLDDYAMGTNAIVAVISYTGRTVRLVYSIINVWAFVKLGEKPRLTKAQGLFNINVY